MNEAETLEKMKLFQHKLNKSFRGYLKQALPTLISALIVGSILRYILAVRGIEYVIIAGIIIIAVKRK